MSCDRLSFEMLCSPALDRAGRWFLNSGIQEEFGGVARYYRSDVARNARVSTEITGYAVSALVYLHSSTGGGEYLDAALRAGRFLTRQAWSRSAHAFPFECGSNGGGPAPLAYFFDSGIIVRGLLSLWRVTRDREFLDSARVCGESMAADFRCGSAIHPVLALPSKHPLAWEPRWSRSPGCYQLKSALGWCELAEETDCAGFRLHYENALASALESHASFLSVEPDRERVMDRLHAYCYFLEGLLPSAARPECARALREGIERTARCLREIAPQFERSDVSAQLLRVRLFAERLGAVPVDEEAAHEEARRIAAFQLAGEDTRTAGGFAFGRKSGDFLPYVNPVSTAFCLQALRMWAERQAGRFDPGWQTLI